MKEEWGDLAVRNVDLVIWEQIKKMADEHRPKVSYGPYLTEIMREHIERHKKS